MSHYFVGVIIKNPSEADKKIEKLMAPYDENAKVEPYDEECWCIGVAARKEINEQLDKKFDTVDEARKGFRQGLKFLSQMKDEKWQFTKEGGKFIDVKWMKLMKPRLDAEKLLEESHPGISKANPNCKDCNGTGKRNTTYNPKSKWDWYCVGGRWDGMITNDRKPSEDGGFNFGDQHREIKNNVISVKDYLEIANKHPDKVIPFAIVTPEGEWCEKGKMGWWAIVSDEKDEEKWLNEAVGIVKKYPGHYIVGVDCHI